MISDKLKLLKVYFILPDRSICILKNILLLVSDIAMSGGVYGGDEVGALVFDPGHFSLRVGYAGEDCPKAEIPSVVGTSPDNAEGEDMDTGEGVKSKKKYHVDTVMLNYPKKDMEVSSFMKDGMVADWDMFEQVLDYSYKKIIQSPSEYHPVLFRYLTLFSEQLYINLTCGSVRPPGTRRIAESSCVS